MKLTSYITTVALLLFLQQGCRNASFENVDKDEAQKYNSGSGDGTGTGAGDSKPELPTVVPSAPVPAAPAPSPVGKPGDSNVDPNQNTAAQKPVLTVSTPSPEIKAGGEKIQATAKIIDQVEPPVVRWTITGPVGRTEIGTIDQNGVYTSPKDVDKEFPITITATLISDPTVSASTPLTVLPNNQIFARCTRGNEVFPILAQVYQVNATITKLPDFSNSSEARKITTVCMDKYAVAPRNFSTGFPDVPGLMEFFALQTTTTLIVPADGDYVIYINSDDGAKVTLDGTLILDNDGLHQAMGSSTEDSQVSGSKEVTLKLLKGDHKLTLDYFQGPKYRIALELKWKKPGSNSYEYIPRQSFK